MEEEESNGPKKKFGEHFMIYVISFLILLLIGSVGLNIITFRLGVTAKPVFLQDGKLVQIIDTRKPLVVEKTVFKKVEDSEKEIQKIAYCLQSLQPKLSIEVAQIIAKHTYTECKERSISVPLWIALMFTESSLDPMKSSNADAHGLCQVRYATWKEQPELLDNDVPAKDKLFWIDLNIRCGTTIFKRYYDESDGKVGPALWRYNSGQPKLPGGKRAYDIEYVAKVMYYAYKINELFILEEDKLHTMVDSEAMGDVANGPVSKDKEKHVKK